MASKHIHKLKKHKFKNGEPVFHCVLPDCYFRIPCPLALGKQVLCNICDEPFLLNESNIRLARPHCANCGKKAVKIDGKKHFISKRANHILTSVAAEDVSSLRDRLDNVTKVEEDI